MNERLNKWLALALGVESPFPWQVNLLKRFVAGDLPPALDIPTGLGKTAVMAIWLIARAAGAGVPRRLVYVVDRRAVVDQATKVAEDLRRLVEEDADLKRALGLNRSLPISTLRGQFADNREWLVDPSDPSIVVGTVDMVGSRLLFEGYGVSRKMRPYHAGLLANDALVIVDEAHLVPPFARLVDSIATEKSLAGTADAVAPPLRLLSLSATGGRVAGAMNLGPEDLAHPVVKKRLSAAKSLELREAVERKLLPSRLAEEARSVMSERPLRCVVFCDSREDAQKVFAELNSKGKDTIEAELFVGARRGYERSQAAEWLDAHGFVAGSDKRSSKPTFLVATSAGEVGVDLDADHMVSDLVSWERMVQRLGRVNRRGAGAAKVLVIPVLPDSKTVELVKKHQILARSNAQDAPDEDDDDESDEESNKKRLKPAERAAAERQLRIEATEAVLAELPASGAGKDASPGAITELKRRALIEQRLSILLERATTPEPLRPALTRPLADAWSMTSLEEHTGRPEVAPWLRGWDVDEEAQTTVLWRTHLPVDSEDGLLGKADMEIYLDAAPPHLLERLETESWHVEEWFISRIEKIAFSKASALNEELVASVKRDILAVAYRRDGTPRVIRANDVRTKDSKFELRRWISGATLIVDERLGGLNQGLLDTDSEEAQDIGAIKGSGTGTLPFRMRISSEETVDDKWREEARFVRSMAEEKEVSWLLIESDPSKPAESEEGRSAAPMRAQLLDEHQDWTAAAAKCIAERLSLSAAHVEMLTVAARLHDEGKRAESWQRAFQAPAGGVYAKTKGRPNFRLLNGYRHELGSLPRAEKSAEVLALEPSLRDLCLHLVASHHGYARPLIRTKGAEEPPALLRARAQDVALRYIRLQKLWGPWGLAWWEALLRAADQQASRRNDQDGHHG